MKLITEDSIAGFSYDDASSQFKGSFVEEWLREEFYTNLSNKTAIVVTAPYCNQAYETATSVRQTCDPNSVVNSKVGLITLDEYNILGADAGFLNTGDQFFTMTPTSSSKIAHIDYNGIRKTGNVTNTYAIRPVITVSNTTRIRSGKGTVNDPYRFENDESAKSGVALTSRNAGEYVTFAGQNWRIVKTGSVTRLVMDSLYKVEDAVQKPTYGNDQFNLTNGIGEYLNNTVYNALFTEKEKLAMAKLSLYNAPYHPGANPRTTSLRATGTRIDAYVGLNSVGSLLSGNSSSARLKGVTGWLMNYNDTTNGYSWYTSTGGTAGSDVRTSIRGVKPVIALRDYVTIASGSGTSQDPYVLNY